MIALLDPLQPAHSRQLPHSDMSTPFNSVEPGTITVPSTPPSISGPKVPAEESPFKPHSSFARLRTRTNSPTIVAYWTRLSKLLRETQTTVASLKTQLDAPSVKGWNGIVATNLQGLYATEVKKTVERESERSKEWREAYVAGGLGGFASYGVGSNLAPWVASKLSEHGWNTPTVVDDIQEDDTATDSAVEAVRVRVWEAEPAYLPVEAGEIILSVRKRLRRFRNRVELCVKILGGLEGRGRKITPAALEKAKVMLEKADQMHLKEEQRLKAAGEKERERERQRQKKTRMKEGKKLQKVKEPKRLSKLEKQKKQESAQAMFMMRFVKQKTPSAKDIPNTDGNEAKKSSAKADTEPPEDKKRRILKVASDKDTMSIAWWLLSEIDAPGVDGLGKRFKSVAEKAQPSQDSEDSDIGLHLKKCADMRKAAERTIDRALLNYRRERTQHLDDRTPRFARRRADVRGRYNARPIKLLQFEEDYRPAFFGTDSRKSKSVHPRRPFEKDTALDYSYDSAEEWEDDEDGEDIPDEEAENERANEDAELRRLYGSDDEDDDDFLDDGDVEEDVEDEESDGGDVDDASKGDEINTKGLLQLESGAEKLQNREHASIILTDAIPGSGKKKVRGPLIENGEGSKWKKRRRDSFKQNVVIQGVSIPVAGIASPLDCHPVTVLEGAPRITVFNPYVTYVSNYLQEMSPPKHVSVRIPRTSLDEGSKLDLAVAITTTKERTSRDAIVYQFCERRRSQGLPVPPKVEVVRAMRVLATNEKRSGDTRAGWYLSDDGLEAKVRAMNLESAKLQTFTSLSEGMVSAATPRSAATVTAVGERIAAAAAAAAAATGIDTAKRIENSEVACVGVAEECGVAAEGVAMVPPVSFANVESRTCGKSVQQREAQNVTEGSSCTKR